MKKNDYSEIKLGNNIECALSNFTSSALALPDLEIRTQHGNSRSRHAKWAKDVARCWPVPERTVVPGGTVCFMSWQSIIYIKG